MKTCEFLSETSQVWIEEYFTGWEKIELYKPSFRRWNKARFFRGGAPPGSVEGLPWRVITPAKRFGAPLLMQYEVLRQYIRGYLLTQLKIADKLKVWKYQFPHFQPDLFHKSPKGDALWNEQLNTVEDHIERTPRARKRPTAIFISTEILQPRLITSTKQESICRLVRIGSSDALGVSGLMDGGDAASRFRMELAYYSL